MYLRYLSKVYSTNIILGIEHEREYAYVLLEKQSGSITATYSYGNELIGKDCEYPLYDGQGLERTVTKGSQTVIGTLTLDGFGQQVASTGSSTNPYTYVATSGYRNDNDAGLSLVGARYYDSQVGRFITHDSDLDECPYLYCNHDPVNYLDPSGHNAIALAWGFTELTWEIPVVGQVAIAIAVGITIGVAIGTGINECRRITPKTDKDKPWVRHGRGRSGSHYDPDPNKRHGGPHLDFPKPVGGNYRLPMPGNTKTNL